MSYLCYLCLFAYKGVQHTLCCVFVLFFFVVYPMLSVSLDVPLLIAPSVFSNVYFRQCDIFCCSLQILRREKLSENENFEFNEHDTFLHSFSSGMLKVKQLENELNQNLNGINRIDIIGSSVKEIDPKVHISIIILRVLILKNW